MRKSNFVLACQHCRRSFRGEAQRRYCSRTCSTAALKENARGHLDDVEAFWARVRRGPASNCWNWTGARNSKGYGCFTFGGRVATAHSIAFRVSHPHVAVGRLRVAHTCGNRLCCNPAHLEAAVMRDAAAPGAAARPAAASPAIPPAASARTPKRRHG